MSDSLLTQIQKLSKEVENIWSEVKNSRMIHLLTEVNLARRRQAGVKWTDKFFCYHRHGRKSWRKNKVSLLVAFITRRFSAIEKTSSSAQTKIAQLEAVVVSLQTEIEGKSTKDYCFYLTKGFRIAKFTLENKYWKNQKRLKRVSSLPFFHGKRFYPNPVKTQNRTCSKSKNKRDTCNGARWKSSHRDEHATTWAESTKRNQNHQFHIKHYITRFGLGFKSEYIGLFQTGTTTQIFEHSLNETVY